VKIPKEYVFAIAAVICVIVAGMFYTSDRRRSSQVYEMMAATAIEPFELESQESMEYEYRPIEQIKVYIAGAVINPGVYELEEGSRVEDVLRLAGGPTYDADLLRINLAARIQDEQQIIVPKEGEIIDNVLIQVQNSDSNDTRININTADEAKLMELPGIGQVTAGNIVSHRNAHGDFNSIEEIQNVTRIGPRTFENIKDLITV